jgi:CubicO group peptidase (beta-lactamase class C family)
MRFCGKKCCFVLFLQGALFYACLPRAIAQDDVKPAAASGTKLAAEPAPEPAAEPAVKADEAPNRAAAASPARNGPTDRAELEAFVDGIMAAQLRDKHIAGATIAFVVDNRPFFAKGYGYADVEARKPVNPDETMFRVGSVSKLFTWTAVMRLAEQGKLDLEADINNYLKEFKIPPTYPEPVTLKHLLAHTPGFEDHVIGLFGRSADDLQPLGQLLSRRLPARVRKPGELAYYW